MVLAKKTCIASIRMLSSTVIAWWPQSSATVCTSSSTCWSTIEMMSIISPITSSIKHNHYHSHQLRVSDPSSYSYTTLLTSSATLSPPSSTPWHDYRFWKLLERQSTHQLANFRHRSQVTHLTSKPDELGSKLVEAFSEGSQLAGLQSTGLNAFRCTLNSPNFATANSKLGLLRRTRNQELVLTSSFQL